MLELFYLMLMGLCGSLTFIFLVHPTWCVLDVWTAHGSVPVKRRKTALCYLGNFAYCGVHGCFRAESSVLKLASWIIFGGTVLMGSAAAVAYHHSPEVRREVAGMTDSALEAAPEGVREMLNVQENYYVDQETGEAVDPDEVVIPEDVEGGQGDEPELLAIDESILGDGHLYDAFNRSTTKPSQSNVLQKAMQTAAMINQARGATGSAAGPTSLDEAMAQFADDVGVAGLPTGGGAGNGTSLQDAMSQFASDVGVDGLPAAAPGGGPDSLEDAMNQFAADTGGGDLTAPSTAVIDPETGQLVDSETGLPIDTTAGGYVDPETGMWVDTGLPGYEEATAAQPTGAPTTGTPVQTFGGGRIRTNPFVQ